ncbi:VWA domain-containing protein [Macrococcus equipercicus]|uniref:VWA domain-containing protein n=1 Tax=Macrococcus equipercicus TaxID=69967 RepID=A0ABQ6RA97_9STAP|nr:VWA domain-containing protein [Macrococcus equipercicus]KAA1040242.1 VWA domain-containing protein [Macrococcus equipercicus]
MADKFILFNDEKIDPTQLMMLTDLAQLIMEDNEVKVGYQKFGYFDPLEKELNVSFKWRHRGSELYALKSDCLLYGLGYSMQDQDAIHDMLETEVRHRKFFMQLFVMLEEQRLTRLIVRVRPAARKFFKTRRTLKRQDNASQLTVYRTKKMPTDLLFLQLEEALLTDNVLDLETSYSGIVDARLRELLSRAFDTLTTADSADIAIGMMYVIDDLLTRDMLNDYYYLPVKLLEDIKRFKEIKAVELDESAGESGHVETEEVLANSQSSDSESGSYMQTEIAEGRNSRIEAAGGRAGSDSDEVTEIMAGRGKSTAQKDGDGVDISEEVGEENSNVIIEWRTPVITPDTQVNYSLLQKEVLPEVRKLTSIIQKTIAHRSENTRTRLAKGLLDKKLTNWFLDEQKRLFYKKDQQSKELDATFTLLVDASYSMEDKIEETKKGIVLFHETLKKLLIRHEVMAFNEDTFSSDQHAQRNIFDYLVNYQESLSPAGGTGIASIKAQDDNRDGLAIRVAGEMIRRRSEQQKFLIVFSDGEPSAFSYESNGIIDTHEAVMNLRRQGVFVINIFLSQSPIDPQTEATIKNIYNDYCVFVEGVEKLPFIISPLLKKLLLQSLR